MSWYVVTKYWCLLCVTLCRKGMGIFVRTSLGKIYLNIHSIIIWSSSLEYLSFYESHLLALPSYIGFKLRGVN